MPSALPQGDPAPADGALPVSALSSAADLGIYVHVPFCASRCGYCDFNTYTAGELGSATSVDDYLSAARAEIDLAARVMGRDRPLQTVFFGGGTPTMLPAPELAGLLHHLAAAFELAPGAEVTTEANPDSVDLRYLETLREAGFTRVSLGMQSARPHVLAILDRTHTPGRAEEAVALARKAGFDHVSLDLIYGTPGETDDDWRASLVCALSAPIDHLSAYALVVEDGTALARKVRAGAVAPPDDDVLADRYVIAERLLTEAGMQWYEVSNWSRDKASRCRHNELYWRNADWWGIGPGAHSHISGVRWWNVKHPAAYSAALANARSPAAGRETLTAADRELERTLLEVRLRDGLRLSEQQRPAAAELAGEGLVELVGDHAVLTLRGRLLADAVVRALT